MPRGSFTRASEAAVARAFSRGASLVLLAALAGACRSGEFLELELDDECEPGDAACELETGTSAGDDDDDDDALQPLSARFELAPADADFFRAPWPSDLRLLEDGTVDLHDFPGAEHYFVEQVRAALEHTLVGFSTSPVVYIQLDRDPGPGATGSIEPAETLAPDAAIQLIELGPGCGARTPVLAQIDAVGDAFASPPLLEVTPVEGFALRPLTTYALVVLRGFGAPVGFELARPAAMDELLDGTHSDARANEVYAPLRACLEQGAGGLAADDVAVATVFTTQDPVGEMRVLREFVRDPARVPAPVVTESWVTEYAGYAALEGRVDLPIFMRGKSPYVTGGGFEYTPEGDPIIQRWESAPFVIQLPNTPPPHPVVLWQDGTGWSEWGHAGDDPNLRFLEEGFAVLAFMPQFHGSRATPGSDPEISTYNYLNAEAGRTTLRQQAAEVIYALRLIKDVLPTLEGLKGLKELDTDRVVYGGHSQGTIPGAILAAVERDFAAYVINGAASYLSITIVERMDYDIQGMLKAVLGVDRDFDRFHPAVQVAQMGADAVEPHNYALQWGGTPERPRGANVFIINGYNDVTTHPIGMSYLTIAGDAAPIEPAGWEVDPHGVWAREPEALPIAGNRVGYDDAPHTVATYLDPLYGHHTLGNQPTPRELAVGFFLSAIDGQAQLALP
ncbi:MAG: hypothetical protein KC468_35135 [Myxococcales bacterium]|nr:hypothetical protein [Myxococcales bacterium]